LPDAVATERSSGGPTVRTSAQVRLKRARLRARLQAAYAMEGEARTDAVQNAQRAYARDLRLYRRADKSLPSGKFRSLSLRVMRLAADAGAVRTIQADRGNIRLGIGSRRALDALKTPSATPLLTGAPTTSPHNILWRHLEFGTGIYRSRRRGRTRFQLPGGGWFFGESANTGLRLRGSKGVHALWDAEGRAYVGDQQALSGRFRQLFVQALFR
jgi:hypothetical protein